MFPARFTDLVVGVFQVERSISRRGPPTNPHPWGGTSLACPSPQARVTGYPAWPVATLVLIVDPAQRTAVVPFAAAAALGVTPMESQVAVLMAEGMNVCRTAVATGRHESTVRSRERLDEQSSSNQEVPTMQYRPGLMALALLAAFPQSTAEAATRVSLAIAKSSHPESARDYSTVHPGLGVTGRLAGEWLRWRAGVVRHSHSRWGPVTGLAATWGVAENWRVGLSAGIVGNYPRGHWVRRGVVPIAQWMDEDRDLVWEFALARDERVTFVGVGLQIPLSVLATRRTASR